MQTDTLSDIGLIKITKDLDRNFDDKVLDGIESAVEEMDFTFNKRTGWNYSPDGESPSFVETIEELNRRFGHNIERKIDWEAVRQTPQGKEREEEVARQSCQITKELLKQMSDDELDIDRIPF